MAAREPDNRPVGRAGDDPGGRRVLVCSAAAPPLGAEGCVDVRPGAVATFDGDRVRLPLAVSTPGHRVRVAWIDHRGLDDAVSRMLAADTAEVVRFGDRAACRGLLGRANTATVERRLAATARAAAATLVSWTDRPRSEVDSRPYDVVVEGTTGPS
jgi:hypothetical protein